MNMHKNTMNNAIQTQTHHKKAISIRFNSISFSIFPEKKTSNQNYGMLVIVNK